MTKDEMVSKAIDAIVSADSDKAAQVAMDALAAGMRPEEVMADGFIVGISAVGERAAATVDEILAAHRPLPLPPGADKKIEQIIAAAGHELPAD